VHLWSFLGVAAVLVITPGPDMALVTRNALLHGRRAALSTALGINAGLLIWTVAAAFGLAAVVRASAVAFTVLKVAGAAYLLWLGVQALRAARRRAPRAHGGGAREPRRVGGLRGFRQGLASNVANPKIAVLFTSLLPQFASPGEPGLVPFLLLGGLFVAMGLVWLCGYAIVASAASAVLERPRIKAAVDRVTGVVLVALGVRLATEPR
jgi:threonine/homoserine/homoserine lactone efflux protein